MKSVEPNVRAKKRRLNLMRIILHDYSLTTQTKFSTKFGLQIWEKKCLNSHGMLIISSMVDLGIICYFFIFLNLFLENMIAVSSFTLLKEGSWQIPFRISQAPKLRQHFQSIGQIFLKQGQSEIKFSLKSLRMGVGVLHSVKNVSLYQHPCC